MTDCTTQLSFWHLPKMTVTADFEGGSITSDGGMLWLRSVDDALGLTASLTSCIRDRRERGKVRHGMGELLRQRIYQIAAGYEDANDAGTLRQDPALKIAVGRAPESGADLASQPTLSRLENEVTERQLQRLSRALLSQYLAHRPDPTGAIILDLDSTDDPTHGQQELACFHGFYDQHMYHPLLCFDGTTGDLLAATLRPGNAHASSGAVATLDRIVTAIRKRWPGRRIIVRADAGFAIPALYDFCERRRLGYVIGLITNSVLEGFHAPLLAQAVEQYQREGVKARLIDEVGYRAGSWERFRRVIMKAEAMPQGTNRRFVVTNLTADPATVYDFYIGRGDVENRIKDLKVALRADRLSCHRFTANAFRLLLHAAAYVLMHALRALLGGTELAAAQFDTIRLRLLKVGARVRQTVRRVWVHLASGYPHRTIWYTLHERLALLASSPG